MARPLTRAEIIDKMHIVPVFSVINAETKQMCPVAQEDGSFCGCWFVDLADAEEHLAKLKAGHAEMQCTIEVTPLSKAFALSEQWVGTAALSGAGGVPLKLQASKAELARLPGFPPLPESLRRAFNPRTSRMPVWPWSRTMMCPDEECLPRNLAVEARCGASSTAASSTTYANLPAW